MALRQALGASSGELMREDAIPCGRMTRIFSTVAGVGGVFLSWPLCSIHYGPRITWPRVFRWQICGAVGAAAAMATFARLWEPACTQCARRGVNYCKPYCWTTFALKTLPKSRTSRWGGPRSNMVEGQEICSEHN